jgi:hypothetical protein
MIERGTGDSGSSPGASELAGFLAVVLESGAEAGRAATPRRPILAFHYGED